MSVTSLSNRAYFIIFPLIALVACYLALLHLGMKSADAASISYGLWFRHAFLYELLAGAALGIADYAFPSTRKKLMMFGVALSLVSAGFGWKVAYLLLP
jgi:hypothetical protein